MLYLVWKQNVFIVLQHCFNCIVEIWVPYPWTIKAWKQVRYETEEEWYVFKHKLWQIHVTQRTH